MMDDDASVPLNVRIQHLSSTLCSTSDIANDMSRYLWSAWGPDFSTFCGISDPRRLADAFVSQSAQAICASAPSAPAQKQHNKDGTGGVLQLLSWSWSSIIGPLIGNHNRAMTIIRKLPQLEFKAQLPITFVAYHEVNRKFVGTATLDVDDMNVSLDDIYALDDNLVNTNDAGTTSGSLPKATSPANLWLANVYVVPHYRGLGIGKLLCQHALDYARHVMKPSGYASHLHLWTFNEQLQSWYTTMGFRNVGIIDQHGEHRQLRVMATPL
jgi:GNAT superfamily N-acetyltransferase